jgi:hypothetical protein
MWFVAIFNIFLHLKKYFRATGGKTFLTESKMVYLYYNYALPLPSNEHLLSEPTWPLLVLAGQYL